MQGLLTVVNIVGASTNLPRSLYPSGDIFSPSGDIFFPSLPPFLFPFLCLTRCSSRRRSRPSRRAEKVEFLVKKLITGIKRRS